MEHEHVVPLHRAATTLGPLLRTMIEPLKKQADVLDVTLTVDVPAALPPIVIDAEKIAWAVATLVGNALRYVRRGTRQRPGGGIHVAARLDGDVALVSVEDDGPGIPQEKIPLLFRRRVGEAQGTGLALLLIHDIVAAHGGRVEVRSSVDAAEHGTRVTLRLPIA